MKRLRTILKKSPFILNLYIRLRDIRGLIPGFIYDFRKQNTYNMLHIDSERATRYHISMIVHFLEKGMCYPNPRPFGFRHVNDLMSKLQFLESSQVMCFEYNLGISALREWSNVFVSNGWGTEPLVKVVHEFLTTRAETPSEPVGIIKFPSTEASVNLNDRTLLTRRTVRDFSSKPLNASDLTYALDCFRTTPTACNRQMCKVYNIVKPELKEILNRCVPGIGGLSKDTINFFVITYDTAAIAGFTERNQGYFNAGLAAMNFVNGLHLSGIESCFLQWNTNKKDDALVGEQMNLSPSERIAVVVGAGYAKSEYVTPYSARKPLSDLYQEVI